jgi:hypothetical protein
MIIRGLLLSIFSPKQDDMQISSLFCILDHAYSVNVIGCYMTAVLFTENSGAA